MFLQKIKLANFKNYESQTIDFSNKINCIVGLNGMGKTNLLDSVYYLCMCKSHFGISDSFIKKHQTDFFRVEGHFRKGKKLLKTVAKVIPKEKKTFELNAVPYERLAEHIGLIPVVMITPYDVELALEGSEVRRKFLDNTLSQLDASYLSALIQYNRILKQRNAALKKMGEVGRVDDSLLDIFDEQLVGPAQLIHQKRKEFSQLFIPLFQNYYKVISGDQESVNYTYRSHLNERTLAELLKENRPKDVVLQRTTVGVHKDDLAFKIEGFPLKKYASQGQMKSFILALKLSQYELLRQQKDCTPLLLLDDIFDKLDKQRVKQLLSLLFENNFGQIFFTDTHENRLTDILKDLNTDFKRFVIESGRVLKQ
ncbi:MAG: DNA replication and repair protein RecF [Bacteroidota bacterium]